MEKTYKQVPFDIELAKKIQSGEIKGKIVMDGDGIHKQEKYCKILSTESRCTDYKGVPHPLVVEYMKHNGVYEFDSFREDGISIIPQRHHLIIELPEETTKTQSDLCEEAWIEEQKHKPYIKQLLKLKDYTEQLMEVNQGVIDNLDNLVQDLKRICESHEQKHEFKPFDKVLVRNIECESPWYPMLYAFYDVKNNRHYCQDCDSWDKVIPYEGNEYLIGTTINIKEE